MKQTNLSVFIPHLGCPNRCSFCDQRTITHSHAPTPEELSALLAQQTVTLSQSGMQAEIAFFGGSFTAIDRGYRNALLYAASEYVKQFPGQFTGIRCSTRPDCIDELVLTELKSFGVTNIELGAQSMSDEVLAANRRGHTAQDVRSAAGLIRTFGIGLGLQMMTGLYKDSPDLCRKTAEEFIKLAPDGVRIYPTVILGGTELAKLYEQGVYQGFGFEETVDLCADLLEMFNSSNIPVIRLGLHASETVEGQMLGGVYHPALGEIVESRLFFREMKKQMEGFNAEKFVIYTDKKNISKINGQKSANRLALGELGFSYKIKEETGTRLRIEALT